VRLHLAYDAVAEATVRVLYEVLKLRWAAGEFTPHPTYKPVMSGA